MIPGDVSFVDLVKFTIGKRPVLVEKLGGVAAAEGDGFGIEGGDEVYCGFEPVFFAVEFVDIHSSYQSFRRYWLSGPWLPSGYFSSLVL